MSALDNFFKLTERGSTLLTEFRAGTATFVTLCYILAVNARLLSDSGGPCQCSEATAADFACRFYDKEYEMCVENFRRQLVTVTALSACVACVAMGAFANLPFALAPGMGLNAYFTYDVVGFRGTGCIPWRMALAAVFVEGIIFFVISVAGLRVKIAKMFPECVKIATTGGIGFFLAHLGLQTAEGIGLVVADVATGITIGGCPPANRTYAVFDRFAYDMGNYPPYTAKGGVNDGIFGCNATEGTCKHLPGVTADSYTCDGPCDSNTKMTSPTTWLGLCVLMIIAVLLKRNIKGAVIIGVLFGTFISWIPGTRVSYWDDMVEPLGGGAGLGGGDYRWEYFKKVAKVEPMDMTAGKLDFNWKGSSKIVEVLFINFFVDFLDTTGTLFSMASFAGLIDPATGDFEGSTKAFIVDGLSTSFGAVLGTSPVTTYIESAPGIAEGGKTGITAIVVGFYFLISIFFAPLLASFPPWATGPALIAVGAMMMKRLPLINWENYAEAIPAFLTIVLMPLTYSIAYGIFGGLISYIVIFLFDKLISAILGEKEEEQKEEDPKVDAPGPTQAMMMPVMTPYGMIMTQAPQMPGPMAPMPFVGTA